jgi:hypothetical protein
VGGIVALVGLLSNADVNVRTNATGTLRNLAANNAINQDAIREAGDIIALVGLLSMQMGFSL